MQEQDQDQVLAVMIAARDWAQTRQAERDQKQAREIAAHVKLAGSFKAKPAAVREEAQWVLIYLRKMNKTKERNAHIKALEAVQAASGE